MGKPGEAACTITTAGGTTVSYTHLEVYKRQPLDYDCDYISGAVWQFSQFGSGNFQGGDGQADVLWTGMYSLINRANIAVSEINKMQNVSEEFKKNALGECYFLKAWAYFYLVRAYGAIPISVSYTHLDVYKRQFLNWLRLSLPH